MDCSRINESDFGQLLQSLCYFRCVFILQNHPKNEGHGWKSCWNPKLGPTSNQRYSMAGCHPGLGIGFRSRCNIWQEEILNDQTPSSKGTFGIFGLENLWLNAGYKKYVYIDLHTYIHIKDIKVTKLPMSLLSPTPNPLRLTQYVLAPLHLGP